MEAKLEKLDVEKLNALADFMVIVHDNQVDVQRKLAELREYLRDMREELDAVRRELARYGKADKPARAPTQKC
jgi:hypothetical protein